jgi:hypothetical protein
MFGIGSLNELKHDTQVIKDILWDAEPRQLMEPRYSIGESGEKIKHILRGYIFYIDKLAEDKPKLFLMCQTGSGYAETVAMIDEAPDDLIAEAITENLSKEYFSMYPINKKIADWIKKECGIEG